MVVAAMCVGAPVRAEGVYSERWLHWRTAHYVVHAHESAQRIGAEVAARVEPIHEALVDAFGWEPRPTHIVVEDPTDSANGLASVVPLNVVRINAVSPPPDSSLGHFDSWLDNLLVHELVHVFHLDRTGGLPLLANRVLGTHFAPNSAIPRWFSEGLAIYFESELTGTGRLNSAYYDAWWRGRALDGAFPAVGELAGDPVTWPYANGWYLYGGHFVHYLIDTWGLRAVTRFIDVYGRQVIPFRINQIARRTIGTGLAGAWAPFSASMMGRAWAQSVVSTAMGGRVASVVTSQGNQTRHVVIDPNGEIAWLSEGTSGRRALVHQLDRQERRVPVETSGDFDFLDASTVIIDQRHGLRPGIEGLDLFALDLLTGELEPVTWGQRAREPAVSPDGRRVAFAAHADGATELRVLDLGSGAIRSVISTDGSLHVSGPTWIDDGAVVVSLAQTGEGRDLYVVNVASGARERLTFDRATAIDAALVESHSPEWKGRWVTFSSDRSGVHDAYALNLDDGRLHRLTWDAVGVFGPRIGADGVLYFSSPGARGYDIRSLPVRQGSVVSSPGSRLSPASPFVSRTEGGMAPRSGLLRTWRRPVISPQVELSTFRSRAGVRVRAGDTPGVVGLDVSATWSFSHREPEGYLWIVNRRLPVAISAFVARALVERTDRMIAESRLIPFVEDQITGSLSLSVPFSSVRDQHAFGLSYSVNHYSMHTTPHVEHDPADRQPVYPSFLRYNALRVSWSYADLERDPEAYTTSRGRYASVSTGIRSPAIGADVQSADVVASAGWVHPLVRDRLVLASRLAGGLASASGIGRSAFVVGGQPPQDLALALLDRLPAGNTSIRGFEPGIASGDRFARAQFELRVPIARLGFGYSTVPLYLRRLHAAVFYDAGFASLEPATPGDVLHGAGVELRLATTLGYVEPASFRLGLARGFGAQGIWDVYFLYGYEF